MERGIRGRLVFAKGCCSSMPFSNPAVWRFRKQRLQVSWLALKTFKPNLTTKLSHKVEVWVFLKNRSLKLVKVCLKILDLQSYKCFIDIICTCIQYNAGFELQQLPDRLTRKLVFILVTEFHPIVCIKLCQLYWVVEVLMRRSLFFLGFSKTWE